MKKIFTLLFSLGIISVSFAQSGHYGSRQESRDVVLGRPSDNHNAPVYGNRNSQVYGNNTGWDNRGKASRIEQIRREYDMRIQSVQRDRFLRNGEKRREIRQLENQRDNEIRSIENSWSNRNVYDRRY
ncbi:MAG: hypothetical protein ACJ75B_10335 [Flavisolibacter sp.]